MLQKKLCHISYQYLPDVVRQLAGVLWKTCWPQLPDSDHQSSLRLALAALLGSWCAAQSGQKKLTVWTCHWWAQLLMQVKKDCSPGLALDGCNHKKVLNSHCLKQTERHFSVCSCLRHCSVGWLLPWPADQHDADDSTCSMPISCNQAKVGCSRNNATDSHAWCSPGLQ